MKHSGSRNLPIALRTLHIVLRPAPILAVIVTAAVLAAALRTAPAGIPLAVMVLSWNARHSMAVLDSLGAGAREVPVLSVEMILGTLQGWRSLLIMLLLVSLLFATGAAAFWIGPLAALGAGALVAMVLPLALLILGWTNKSAAALDPRNWVRVARTLGSDFVQLEAAGVALIAAVVALLSSAARSHMIVSIAVVMFGWLLLVALAGVTTHARRGALALALPFYPGIEVGPSPAEIARQRQQAIDAIYALWRNGARGEAWRKVEELAAAAPMRDDELRWIYRHSLAWDAAALCARIAQELIALDLLAGRTGYALALLREQLAVDHGFKLRTAHATLELARAAARFANPSIALALLAGFEQLTSEAALLAESTRLRDELRAQDGQRIP